MSSASERPSTLGDLGNPAKLHTPLDISNCSEAVLFSSLRTMIRIRMAEERIGDMVVEGLVHCPAHLAIGQEAVPVGVSSHLRQSDRVFGAHRSHGHFIALGGSITALFAEALGRVDGCSRGMGGSMHLHDGDIGFMGSVPIVGASVPIAVGAALAAKFDGCGDIGVAYLGDSALEEGSVQESLNLASTMEVPVLFVCENNLFGSHMHISQRQPDDGTSRFAEAHRVPSATIDGNDVVGVSRTAQEMVREIRDGGGPRFLEAVTYRWRGHVGPREDLDVGVLRDQDLSSWKGRDPIKRLVGAMKDGNLLSVDGLRQIEKEISEEIEIAWRKAEASAFPPSTQLLSCVYDSVSKK